MIAMQAVAELETYQDVIQAKIDEVKASLAATQEAGSAYQAQLLLSRERLQKLPALDRVDTWLATQNELFSAGVYGDSQQACTALLDAFFGGHAGQCTLRDVLVFVGGYTTFYNLFQLVNKRLTGAWLYPVFYEAETAVGPRWAFWAVATPVSLFYCGLGALALAAAR